MVILVVIVVVVVVVVVFVVVVVESFDLWILIFRYYDYETGHVPIFSGAERFSGTLVRVSV